MGLSLAWILTTEGSILAFIFLVLLYSYRTVATSWSKLPPGPRRYPLIGNITHIPTDNQEETFTEWGAQYGPSNFPSNHPPAALTIVPGDVVHIDIFGQSIIILNSLQAARDLLDKRSSIYSDRPRFVLLSELCVSSSQPHLVSPRTDAAGECQHGME
jgi:hypothetical protein